MADKCIKTKCRIEEGALEKRKISMFQALKNVESNKIYMETLNDIPNWNESKALDSCFATKCTKQMAKMMKSSIEDFMKTDVSKNIENKALYDKCWRTLSEILSKKTPTVNDLLRYRATIIHFGSNFKHVQ
jgi:hypothetical protein